jgi:signal transduction histidine kinase
VQFLEYYAPLDLWTEVRGYPTAEGIAVFFRDVSEERRSEAALKQQAEFEQQLVGIVSHDLRNPLNVIQLASTVLLQSGEHDERTMKALARIASSTGRAIRLVRDLLDFTQARLGGGIPIVPKALDLHVLARQTMDEVQTTHPERDLELAACGNGEGVWDPDRLAQVLTNLISNALKYSPPNTPVRVQTDGFGDEIELRVHNWGAPIPAEARARLFQPMHRASAQVSPAERSVGLGLFIVKEIVTGHGGRIDVRSDEPDGTTFTVRLPRGPAPSREQVDPDT